MAVSMLKIRRPLGRLIFNNMGIAMPGKTVFLIETPPWCYGNIRGTELLWEKGDVSAALGERTAMLGLLLFERRAMPEPLLFGGPMISTSGWGVNGRRAARAVTSWMMGHSGVREPLPLIGVWSCIGLSRGLGWLILDPQPRVLCSRACAGFLVGRSIDSTEWWHVCDGEVRH